MACFNRVLGIFIIIIISSDICLRVVLLWKDSSVILRGLLCSDRSAYYRLFCWLRLSLYRRIHWAQIQRVSFTTRRNCSLDCQHLGGLCMLWPVRVGLAGPVVIKIWWSSIQSESETIAPVLPQIHINSMLLSMKINSRFLDLYRVNNAFDFILQLLVLHLN